MKSSSKALIWVVLVFLVGAAFGGTLTFILIRSRLAAVTKISERTQQTRREGILREMLRRLDLDPEQETQVRRILEDTHARYEDIEKSKIQQLRQERRQTLRQIRQLLRPEQKQKLDAFLKELARRRKRHRR